MPTIACQVSASNQDCLVYKDWLNNWQLDLTHNEVTVGYFAFWRKGQGAGLYFPNVPIPPGSTIEQAFLILRCGNDRVGEGVSSLIKVEDNANPSPFSTLADYQARPWWLIFQWWLFVYKKWNQDVLYASPDISKLIQHVIDLPAWAEGNPIVFSWNDHAEKSFTTAQTERIAYSYDDKPDEAPRLEITFTPPGPPPPPPPPPLPTPPPPPRKSWAGLDLQYEYLYDGYKEIFHTDVPCHLYARQTKTPPRRHSLPSMRRGLRITGDIRFCFVNYEDTEQQEPRDTIIHTFIKGNWTVGEVHWEYFKGTIYGDPSPSESPIIKKRFPAPPPDIPPLSVTYLSTGDEDYAQAPDTPFSWNAARNQPWGRWFDNWTVGAWIIQTVLSVRNWIGRYTITRQWLWFDTRDIPPFWQDVYPTVKVRLYIPPGSDYWKGQPSVLPFENSHLTSRGDIIITENKSPSRPIPKTPPGCEWPHCDTIAYGNQLGFETKGGVFYLEDFVNAGFAEGFYEATLNAFGKTLIKPGDYSGFCLRTRVDVENTGAFMGLGEIDQMLFVDPIQDAGYYPHIKFTT